MLETFSFIRYRIFNTYNFISLEFFFISNFQFYYNTNDLFFIFMISQIRIQPLWNRNHTFVPRSSLPTKTTSRSSMPRPLYVSMLVLLTQHSATFWWYSLCFLSLARIFLLNNLYSVGCWGWAWTQNAAFWKRIRPWRCPSQSDYTVKTRKKKICDKCPC